MKKIKREIWFKDIKDVVIIDRHQYDMMMAKLIAKENKLTDVTKLVFRCEEHKINDLEELIDKLEKILF